MHTRVWRYVCLFTLLALLTSSFGQSSAMSTSTSEPQMTTYPPGMQVIPASYVGESQPLRSMAPVPPSSSMQGALSMMQDRLVIPKTQNDSDGRSDTSILQSNSMSLTMPEPIANFEGVHNVNGVLPPDTQGDIGYDPVSGTKFYVQWVNLSFQVWDVSDPANPVSLYGPAAGNTLWAGSNTICDYNNDGDPITLFDPLAKRWMMSQFALGFPNNFHQCIAVSATADPTGVWYLYDFLTSTTMMNDYPKFGVWPDGYYMTVNQFNGTSMAWGGAGVAVFERDAMLLGQPARMIYIDIGQVTKDYGGMLPSDLDGPVPPAGSPNYFMEWDDSSWLGDPQDMLRIWEFHTDWANPANTSFGVNASYDPNLMIATSNLDPDLCNYSASCIPQPGTTVGLDALSDRLMYRLQYRNFGDYQILLTNHTVDVNGSDKAGVHWFELRDSGSGWNLYQEGVYAPGEDHYWMASIAMDDSGNIGLGYSISSSTLYPSIRYTGRLAADPAGLMPQGESSLIEGSGSQLSTHSRWGDYSMMAVDPSDGCTFWYTQEYIETTGNALWQTRIGSFKFPSCTSLPTGTLTGMVTDGSSPLPGATVTATGEYATITNAEGVYTLELPAGIYDVTASTYGYLPSTESNISISSDSTTSQDFTLELGTLYEVTGYVGDSVTGWPLYARIDMFGYPYNPIFTDPVTGMYSVMLAEGAYNFTVKAISGGYSTGIASVVVSGDMAIDFPLVADLLECTAPGYIYEMPSFSEDFETWPLESWSIVSNTAGGLLWDSSEAYGDGNYTGGEGLAADVNSDKNQYANYDTELVSPVIEAASLANLHLVYKANFQIYSGREKLDLDISNNDGASWSNILSWSENHGALYGSIGETVSVDLTPYAGDNFKLRWRYYTREREPWDWYAQVDEVKIGARCFPNPDGGLVVGGVFDENTSLPVSNPWVNDASFNPVMLINTVQDPSVPNPLYIIGAPGGAVELTASAERYQSTTQFPVVVPGSTIRNDFYLPAGWLSADPASLAYIAFPPYPVVSQSLTLDNLGGAGANYEVFAIEGAWTENVPTGPFAPNTRHIGPKSLNDLNAAKLRVNTTPVDVPALEGGSVSDSWDSGLGSTWGIGFNLDASNLWLGSPSITGGDDFNHHFLTDGSKTGETIDTSPWVAIWAADMTYNPFTHKLWQVNVGGDNCIYEMDPLSMLSTGNKICPAFGTSQRGLAFDPLTNTYYTGSWNDGIINHFAPDGSLLDSAAVGLSIAGLAFNPGTGHLFVLNNHESSEDIFDVYVLDTNESYQILGGFDLTDGTAKVYSDYNQAGLEMDCSGKLWAVDQGANRVYVADSGETGVCDWQAGWLSAEPASTEVPVESSNAIQVTVDITGMPVGNYQAYLRLVSDTPYEDILVPVWLEVRSPLFLILVVR